MIVNEILHCKIDNESSCTELKHYSTATDIFERENTCRYRYQQLRMYLTCDITIRQMGKIQTMENALGH